MHDRLWSVAAAFVVTLLSVLKAQDIPIPTYPDDYRPVSRWEHRAQWGPYNVHDPSLARDGDWVYMFSTDGSFGGAVPRGGIQVRRSRDLVNWEFVGFALDGVPESILDYLVAEQKAHGEQKIRRPWGFWAPCVRPSPNGFRMYYCVSVLGTSYSVIGLAESAHLAGPWTDKGMVVCSTKGSEFNAIDASVITEPEGRQWMLYGSWFGGIAALELEPKTGQPLHERDPGKRVSRRGSKFHQPMEAPEVIYHPGLRKYVLFVAYDPVIFRYNLRVAMADRPEGPYTDFQGRDINEGQDIVPMILHPYRFRNHPGWQGTAHCGLFEDKGRWFLAHQGRLSNSRENDNSQHLMVLHLREVLWLDNGWPVVSPERYAGIEQKPVKAAELVGDWEHIVQTYHPGHNRSGTITFSAAGEIIGNQGVAGHYAYDAAKATLTMTWQNGFTDEVKVLRGLDWERDERRPTVLYTGLNKQGIAIWGKWVGKPSQQAQPAGQ